MSAISLFAATSASAVVLSPTSSPLAGSNFQGGDGDQETAALLDDWQDIAASPDLISTNDPNALDTAISGKEDEPVDWDLTLDPGGSTPAKSNFFATWSFLDADTFLYLAFNRAEAGGNAFLAFELNQESKLWTNDNGDQIACRTDGDLIISYEIQNSNNIDIVTQEWVTDTVVTPAEDPVPYLNGTGCAKTGHFIDTDPGAANAQAAINFPGNPVAVVNGDGSVDNFLPISPAAATFPEGTFGEAALNLPGLFTAAGGDPCFSFGQLSAHSRTAKSSSAGLSDIVGPTAAIVRSCTISGTKWYDADADGVFDPAESPIEGYVVYIDANSNDVFDVGEETATTDVNGEYVFEDQAAGTYSIREAPDSEQIPANQNLTCTFPNPCEHSATLDAVTKNDAGNDFGNVGFGTIEVVKDLDPNADPGLFDLQVNGNTEAADVSDGGSTGPIQALAGDNTVGEVAGTGTTLDDYQKSIDCTGGESTGPDDGGPLTVNVSAGEDVVCTITNVRETGTITVVKDLNPNADPGLFDLEVNGAVELADASDGDDTGQVAVNTGVNTVGESAGSVGDLADYDKSISCNGGESVGPDSAGPLNVTISDGENEVCTITNVRETGTITVVKDLNPNADPGLFDLEVNGAVELADASDGDDTGQVAVNTGVNTVGESAGSVGDLADYDKSISCNGGESVGPDSAGPLNVTISDGENEVCTITNVRETGTITVVKDLNPNADPGLFDLEVNGAVELADASDGDDTGQVAVNTGVNTVGESAGSVGDLADYDKSISCNGGESVGPDSAGPLNVTISDGENEVCTITNVRETGTITVVKDLNPNADPGLFDLEVNGAVELADASDGDDTGQVAVNTGVNTVGESAGSVGDLADYDKSISCNGGESVGPDSAGPLNVTISDGENEVCTITNVRETGTITVVKDLNPNADPGLFDLEVNGAVELADASDGDDTGQVAVNTGVNTVGESAGSVGDLADYDKSISCNGGESVGPDSAGPLNVTISDGENEVCTITNVRETGTITVVKDLNPNADPGLFDLEVNGAVELADASDGDDTGQVAVNTGVNTVGESAGSVGDLADYDKSISCNGGESVGPDSAGPLNVTISDGENEVCTITNVRETGTITVVKDLNPNADPGLFDLEVNGAVELADASDGDDTGQVAVNTGVNTVGESAGSVGDLADYDKSISCNGGESVGPDSAGPLNVTISDGENEVCTITNVRETGTITVVKDLNPNADPGLFDLQIDGVTEFADAGDGDDTGAVSVNTGNHTVGETAGSVGSLADYDKSISCTGGEATAGDDAGPLGVNVADGENVVCTVTNVRDATVTVVKDAQPNDPQNFNFSGLPGGAFDLDDDADPTLSNSETVTITSGDFGPKTITEGQVGGWSLSDVDCTNVVENTNLANGTTDFTVGAGDNIVCAFTNKKDASVTIVKNVEPVNSPQDFHYATTGGGLSDFDLDDDGDPALSNSATFTIANADGFGIKTVTEQLPSGWEQSSLECTGDDNSTTQGSTATLDVDPGEQITCTYGNRANATITIIKDAQPDDPTAAFTFTTTGSGLPPSFELDDDGTEPPPEQPPVDQPPANPDAQAAASALPSSRTFTITNSAGFGQKTVTEQLPADWALIGVTCNEGTVDGLTATLQVDAGDQIVCTFAGRKIQQVPQLLRKIHYSVRFRYVDKHARNFVVARVYCHSVFCVLAGRGTLKILAYGKDKGKRAKTFKLGVGKGTFEYVKGRTEAGALRFKVPPKGAKAVKKALRDEAYGSIRATINIAGLNTLQPDQNKRRFRDIKVFSGKRNSL